MEEREAAWKRVLQEEKHNKGRDMGEWRKNKVDIVNKRVRKKYFLMMIIMIKLLIFYNGP